MEELLKQIAESLKDISDTLKSIDDKLDTPPTSSTSWSNTLIEAAKIAEEHPFKPFKGAEIIC